MQGYYDEFEDAQPKKLKLKRMKKKLRITLA